jgi:hypothetical protein
MPSAQPSRERILTTGELAVFVNRDEELGRIGKPIEERIEHLEREVSAIKIIFENATGFDSNRAEDLELLRVLIEESPGLSQTGVCCAARTRYSLSRNRTIELLRLGVGKFWRVQGGLYNSLLYHPIANGMHTNSGEKTSVNTSMEVQCADLEGS